MNYYKHWLPRLLTAIIPKAKWRAIVLFANIYYGIPEHKVDERLRRHEEAHREQQKRDGIFFYIRYILEFLFNLLRYRSFFWAYYNISYEIEARDAERG